MNARPYPDLADCEAGNAEPPTLPADPAEPLTDAARDELLRSDPWYPVEHGAAPRGPWWRQFGGVPELLLVLLAGIALVGVATLFALVLAWLMEGPQ